MQDSSERKICRV